MKTLGIILAAGRSSRLYPATLATTKQLLPIYDKPLIYFPLTTLMLAGIRDILVITNPWEKQIFENLLDNDDLGVDIQFATQEKPRGLPEAFTIAEKHYGEDIQKFDQVALILGDNIYYGAGLTDMLISSRMKDDMASVFLQKVTDPSRFGVAEFDKQSKKVVGMEEKPLQPKSDYAITGLYFFPGYSGSKTKETLNVFEIAERLKPSARGELEILDMVRPFMDAGILNGNIMFRGMSWFDTGTANSLLEAANFIKAIQDHQGFQVGSPHEVAYNYEWIDKAVIHRYLSNWGEKTAYGRYLLNMMKEE